MDPEALVVRMVSELARRRPDDGDVLDLSWAEIGLDSLDLLELAVRCEDELGRPVPDAELVRWSRPRHVVAFLARAG
ncbi:MAG: Phosphopantetheine attachment site [Actinomycetota bacterium]|nr:Phosphopantetheine attachment site [Actinomycetota bacterium]